MQSTTYYRAYHAACRAYERGASEEEAYRAAREAAYNGAAGTATETTAAYEATRRASAER